MLKYPSTEKLKRFEKLEKHFEKPRKTYLIFFFNLY